MVRIGIVGLGGMGTVHYHNYKYIEGAKVAAAVVATEKEAKKADSWGVPHYKNIQEMIEGTSVDVVDICTPTFLHYSLIKEGLYAHKSVIVEKPMVLHSREAEELFKLADVQQVHIYVGQVTRFAKDNEILQRLVRTKQYGDVKDAYFERLSSVPAWTAGNWMLDKEKSGQLAFDLHIHDLDTIVNLFGVPEDFDYQYAENTEKRYKEHYRFQYKYKNVNVCAEAAWYHASYPFCANWRIYFENAVVVNEGNVVTAYPYGKEPYQFEIQERKIPTGINVPPTEMYFSELSHFVSCVERNIDSPRVPREQILSVLSILEKVTYSLD